ncbi:MAG: transglycosylase domain-containing protein [Leptolyngbyaceae cyanobacterium]
MSSNALRNQPKQSAVPDTLHQFIKAVTKVTGASVLGITMLTSSIVAGGLVGLAISFRNLPDVRILRSYAPSQTTYIYDMKGKLLASLHGEANRSVVPLDKISPHLKRAVIAIEDSHFYQHTGVNPGAVTRALIANWTEGRTVEGGSTLTMQLVKNLFLTPKRAFSRKLAESVLATRVEQVFSKNQILEMYLNQVYWGHNTYGAETAAQSYFGKHATDLNLAESALMAGLIQAPESLSPFVNYKFSKQRQKDVLNRMADLKWITPQEADAAYKQPLKFGEITSFRGSQLPYITEAATQELTQRFGKDALIKGGMRVQTTVDSKMQRIAEDTVLWGNQKLNNQGVYADQMALVAVDPRTHYVKAMVGGVDYKKSQYNRATQAMRQPGSAFKPFVYYAAFASGKYTPDSIVNDTPVSYPDGYEMYYPQNYDNTFAGPISIRRALEVSRNIPAIRLGQEIGLNKVIDVVRTIGIRSPIEPVVSLPLGSVDLTPLEMAGSYATLASNGWYSETTLIAQVTDSSGNVLLDNTPKPQLVLDPWATASLTDVLRGVVDRGTGVEARFGRPAAGKTGTTSSERDIWFVGYVPQLATAIWAGNDNYSPVGQGATGGGFIAPIWREFMYQALQNTPVDNFRSPSEFQKP